LRLYLGDLWYPHLNIGQFLVTDYAAVEQRADGRTYLPEAAIVSLYSEFCPGRPVVSESLAQCTADGDPALVSGEPQPRSTKPQTKAKATVLQPLLVTEQFCIES
jgi:hypothetical protein